MKKILICLCLTIIISKFMLAQDPCFIKYTYDASGNRINRSFVCEPYEIIPPLPNRPATTMESKAQSADDFIVTPNPSQGDFKLTLINIRTTTKLTIYNHLGQIIKICNNVQHEDHIDLSKQSPGVYYFVLDYNRKKVTRKLTKLDY
jgi:hypothetical protein